MAGGEGDKSGESLDGQRTTIADVGRNGVSHGREFIGFGWVFHR
jgi:hypothetical protein